MSGYVLALALALGGRPRLGPLERLPRCPRPLRWIARRWRCVGRDGRR